MATLTSTKIKNTYDALLKSTDNDAIGSTAKQITDGLGNGTPLYISTTQIGIGVTPEATYDLHVYSNAKVGGNLTVTGDLTVEGTTTTIDTQTLTVEDPLIEVASNNTSTDAVDIGWYGKYAPSGTTLYAGLFRDTGDSKFKLFRNLEEQPTTTVNTSGTGYTVATLVADVEGTLTGTIASSTVATTQSANDNSTKVATTAYVDSSAGNYLPLAGGTMSGSIAMGGNNISGGNTATFTSFVGDLTGNADTATALETARTIQVSGDVAGSASFDGTADINISTTIQPNSVALGTDTTGNYVATISGTANEITVSGSGSESAAVTISLPSSISVDVTGDLTGDVYNADGSIILNTGDNSIDAVLSNGVRATTQSQGDNSTKLATTAYVDSAIGGQDTLSEVLANGNTTGGTDIAVSTGDDITFADSSKSIYGAGSDLQIYHDGSNSYIVDSGSGYLLIRGSNQIRLSNATGTQNYFVGVDNGQVELAYSGSKKFETTSTGISVTGGASFTDNIDINGNNKHIRFIDTYGNWLIEAGDGANNFKIHSQSLAADYLTLEGGGQLNLGEYGSGSFTGTATYRLAVDSSGDVIEIPIGGGAVDGSGTANYVTKWSDTDTITNSVIYDNGTNVGIGTTSPQTYLQLGDYPSNNINQATYPDVPSEHMLHITAPETTNYYGGGISFGENSFTAANIVAIDAGGGGALHLAFGTGNSSGINERMRITSGGKIGIGVSNPDSFYADQLVVNEGMTLYSTGNSFLCFADGTSGDDRRRGEVRYVHSSNSMVFMTNASERMRIDSSGNVKISGIRLNPSGAGGELLFGSDVATYAGIKTTSPAAQDIDLTFHTTTNAGVDGAPERMRIESDGTVQITNSTSPKLQLKRGSKEYTTRIDNANKFVIQEEGGNEFFIVESGASSNSIRIDSSGNVGIGVSPYSFSQLHIYDTSDVFLTLQKGTANGYIINDGTNISLASDQGTTGKKLLVNRSAPDSSLVIDSSGNVGIGTTSPVVKLNVVGSAYFSGNDAWNGGGSEGNKTDIALVIDEGDTIYTRDSNQYLRTLIKKDTGDNIQIGEAGTSLIDNINFFSGSSCSYTWYNNSSAAMKLTSTGLGIGTTSPNFKLGLSNSSTLTAVYQQFTNGTTGTTSSDGTVMGIDSDGDFLINNQEAKEIKLYTSDTQRLTIQSGGNVGIGTESPTYKFHVKSSNNVSIFEDTSGSSGATFCLFNAPSVFAMGSITRNGSATSVLFNTSSDYRLKEDLQDFNALDLVDNITAYDYKWKDTEQRDYGFVAHELQEVMPNVVTGEKDGERMQSVDYSKLTPVLLKAIQELKAEIETLKAQINN